MQQEHEFSVGDMVELIKAPVNVRRGLYEIIRLLPAASDGELQYRIKSPNEPTERVVRETEICSRPNLSNGPRPHGTNSHDPYHRAH